jgi:hypothetical protein
LEKKEKEKKAEEAEAKMHRLPKLGESKLRDLAWSLDVLDIKKEELEN